ncbi:MAG: hypothetical protein ACJAT7_002014, partial [Psychromonas sp.]|uniref:hypothetical protein n=1 Tax=Psychromonas sp. TaxID=1884585 RepID=UPI0039E4A74F
FYSCPLNNFLTHRLGTNIDVRVEPSGNRRARRALPAHKPELALNSLLFPLAKGIDYSRKTCGNFRSRTGLAL